MLELVYLSLSLPGDKIICLFRKGSHGTQWQPALCLPGGILHGFVLLRLPAEGPGQMAPPRPSHLGYITKRAGVPSAPAGRGRVKGTPQAAFGRGCPDSLMYRGSGKAGEIPFNRFFAFFFFFLLAEITRSVQAFWTYTNSLQSPLIGLMRRNAMKGIWTGLNDWWILGQGWAFSG